MNRHWTVGRATITPVVETETKTSPKFLFKGLDKPGVLDIAHRHPVARRDVRRRRRLPAADRAMPRRRPRRGAHRRRHVRRQRQGAGQPGLGAPAPAVPRRHDGRRLRRRTRSTSSCAPTCTSTTSAGTPGSSTAGGCRRSPTPATCSPPPSSSTGRRRRWATATCSATRSPPSPAAGLADLVPIDHRLDGGIRFDPTTGHTPGHVSVVIESAGERAVITGDMIHTPGAGGRQSVCRRRSTTTRPRRRRTRQSFLQRYADDTLVIGTHWGGPGAARVRIGGRGAARPRLWSRAG